MQTVTAGFAITVWIVMNDDVVIIFHRLFAIGADLRILTGYTMGHTGGGILVIAHRAKAIVGIKGVGTLINLYFSAAITHSPMLILIG